MRLWLCYDSAIGIVVPLAAQAPSVPDVQNERVVERPPLRKTEPTPAGKNSM
jgi:hypothetical protein